MKKLVWFIIGSVFVIQCTTPQSKKQLAEINALQQRVDSCQTVLNEIDYLAVKNRYDHVKEQLAAIEQVIPDDQTFEESQYLGMYYDNSKTFKKISKGYEALLKEVQLTQKQLTNLKHDVKHNLVADSNYTLFFNNEKRAVEAIVFETNNYHLWEEKGTKRYNGMHLKIDSILTAYSDQQ